MRFLITQGAADHWFAGPAVSAAGHVVVGYATGSHAYDAAVQKLRDGEYIAILPEAGVSRSFRVRECKTGAVRKALQAGIDAGIADFPLDPAPGAWWTPADLGGGAPSDEERQRLAEVEGPRRAGGRRR